MEGVEGVEGGSWSPQRSSGLSIRLRVKSGVSETVSLGILELESWSWTLGPSYTIRSRSEGKYRPSTFGTLRRVYLASDQIVR